MPTKRVVGSTGRFKYWASNEDQNHTNANNFGFASVRLLAGSP